MCSSIKNPPTFCDHHVEFTNAKNKNNKDKYDYIKGLYLLGMILAFLLFNTIIFFICRKYFAKKDKKLLSTTVEVKVDKSNKEYLRLELKENDTIN
jgi:hypothetical protein